MTVREIVRSIQDELRQGELHPARARECLLTLTALLGSCFEEIREADQEYAVVLLCELNADGPANRAKIRASVSKEYRRKEEAKNTRELVVEMIRALKYYLRSLEEEMRLA